MKILIDALEKIAKIPCRCNCGPVHFADCTQTIAKKALEAAQQGVRRTGEHSTVALDNSDLHSDDLEDSNPLFFTRR